MAEKNITINVNQKGAKQTSAAIENLGKKTKTSMQQLRTSVKESAAELDDLGNKFRYLSIVSGIVATGTVLAGKSFVESATKMEQSVIKLSAYSKIYSADFNDANKAAQDFASTGLMSVTEASTTLSNLLAMGLGLDKAKELMQGMLDTAVTSKENLQDTYGEALIKSSQGMRIFQERQIDAVGINTQLNRVFQEYGKTIHKTTEQMSNAERYQAIYNYYTKEFSNFSGAAAGAANTFSGTLNKLKNNIEQAKTALGNALIPAVGTAAEGLNKLTLNLRNFVNEHPMFSTAVLLGTAGLALFTAAFATIGALVPMVVSGLGIATKALLTMFTAFSKVGLIVAAVSLGIGYLITWILKATGKWDQWSNAIKNVANTMSKALNPIRTAGEEIEEVNDKIAKSIKNISYNIKLFIRDTRQEMTEWVSDHDNKVTDLKDQITNLEKQYNKSTSKIRDDYKKTMNDMSLSHSRRVEDLQREIDEEVSKGIWADQTKIRDLQRELKRENEDYALAKDEKMEIKDEELAEEQTVYNEKLIKLKEELDKELALEKKHQTEINNIRSWGLTVLDEFEKKQQTILDKNTSFLQQLEEIGSDAKTTASSLDEISAANLGIGDTADEAADKTTDLAKQLAEAKRQSDLLSTPGGQFGYAFKVAIQEMINKVYDLVNATINAAPYVEGFAGDLIEMGGQAASSGFGFVRNIGEAFMNATSSLASNYWSNLTQGINFYKGLFSGNIPEYAEGGVIPGTSSTPVPIIAHGGETVLPAGVSPINININNPSVRSDADILAIANQVKQVLSRQQTLRHYM